ncbi:hypothetical protein [Halegenticoccus soli]|uniref:hypothetical protein n=1 Tax=Halegenticoccus soli TaxID=1985678 RepID=UPI000C6D57AD|nr:hypothetical protein [Halegenticoccus soli]
MTNDDQSTASGDAPEAVQDISTGELIDNNYDTALSSHNRGPGGEGDHRDEFIDHGAYDDPGRMRNDDSIAASSTDNPRDDDGYTFSAGYETKAATGVGKPGDPHYDEQLQRVNDGRDGTDGTLSHRQADWDKKRIAQALCSDLPISKRQREQVVLAMERLDLDRFGHQKAIERVCLGVVTVIVNDQRVEQSANLEDVTPVTWEDEFKEIAAKFDVGMSDLATIKELVREQLGERPPEPANAGVNRDVSLPEISPAERPDEYWERMGHRFWVSLARYWEHRDAELKAAIPEEKKELVDLLRQWEPWEMPQTESSHPLIQEATDHAPADDADDAETTSDVTEAEDVSEEVRAEAEALIERMIDDAADSS